MNVPANNGAGNQVIAYVKSNNQTVGGYGEKLGSLISANTAGTYQGNLTHSCFQKS